MTHHNTEQSDSRQITSATPTFTTTDCLNQGHNESSFPGLNVIALQKFDIPYDELTPALQGHVREESVRRAGNDLLAALREACDKKCFCLIVEEGETCWACKGRVAIALAEGV